MAETKNKKNELLFVPKGKSLKKPDVMTPMSKGQQMLAEMFSGREEPLWGTGNNLPVLNGTLITGGGLIKHGDRERRTGGMFGLR